MNYEVCKDIVSKYAGLLQAGGGRAPHPTLFDRSANPISTRGAHYPHPVLCAPQIFGPCDGPDQQPP